MERRTGRRDAALWAPSPLKKAVVNTVDDRTSRVAHADASSFAQGPVRRQLRYMYMQAFPISIRAQHKLLIHDMVKQPLVFDLDALRYRMVTRVGCWRCGGNSAPLFSSR